MREPTPHPSDEEIWHWLDEVADPEIPVLSVVDLGIPRRIEWIGDTLRVWITPTYSGCPATQTIAEDIAAALRAKGIASVQVETQLGPAWTTRWLTDKGKRNLREHGIAPPVHSAPEARVIDISSVLARRRNPSPECPRCGAGEVSRLSEFGSTACKALYRCDRCREPFEYFKPH
jgi:ring-1,2-phenylacetyl-CoA epoxidase subunit PaaD